MDPTACLAEMRRLVQSAQRGEYTESEWPNDACRLVELVESLDDWISRGGFLPEDWSAEDDSCDCEPNTRLQFMGSKWDQPGPEWVVVGSATCMDPSYAGNVAHALRCV